MRNESTRQLNIQRTSEDVKCDSDANRNALDEHRNEREIGRSLDETWSAYDVWKTFIKDARERRNLGLS